MAARLCDQRIRAGWLVVLVAMALSVIAAPGNAWAQDIGVKELVVRDGERYGLLEPSTGPLAVAVVVENVSSTPVAAGVEIQCKLFQPYVSVDGIRNSKIDQSLPAHSQRSVVLLVPGSGKAGAYTLECQLDPNKRIKETSRRNNRKRVDLQLRDFNPNAFHLALEEFGALKQGGARRNDHEAVSFRVRNHGRGVPDTQGSSATAMWQLECVITNMPWVEIREQGHMGRLVSGKLPKAGESIRTSAWFFPLRLYPHPMVEDFAPQLPMACTITVGAFKKMNVPRGRAVSYDYAPVQVWWKKTQSVALLNTRSKYYVPPTEVSLRCLGASASPSRTEPLVPTRKTFARFAVEASSSIRYPHVTVMCTAKQGTKLIEAAGRRVGYASGSVSTMVDLGFLDGGRYTIACALDPLKQVKDSDRSNNKCTMNVQVAEGRAPGQDHSKVKDVALHKVLARDSRRSGLTEPESGGPIWAYAEVENLTKHKLDGLTVGCELYRGSKLSGKGSLQLKQLGGYEKRTERVVVTGPEKTGNHRLKCTVDAAGQIPERNEENNVAETTFKVQPFRKDRYNVRLDEFAPISKQNMDKMFHQTISFSVRNIGDGVGDGPWGEYQPRWQVDCRLPSMPWVEMREQGDMRHLVSGLLPKSSGKTITANAWLDGLRLYPHPMIEQFAPLMPIECTTTVGVFKKMSVPRGRVAHVDWAPVSIWAQLKRSMVIVNEHSHQYRPPDLSVACTGASSAVNARQALESRRPVYLSFKVGASSSTIIDKALLVFCKAFRGSTLVKAGSAKLKYASGQRQGTVEIGKLGTGSYKFTCTVSGLSQQKDANEANNECSISGTIAR